MVHALMLVFLVRRVVLDRTYAHVVILMAMSAQNGEDCFSVKMDAAIMLAFLPAPSLVAPMDLIMIMTVL